jgi:hypothetical protein
VFASFDAELLPPRVALLSKTPALLPLPVPLLLRELLLLLLLATPLLKPRLAPFW